MTRRFITLGAVGLAASACHFGADAEDRDPGSTVSRTYQVGAFDKIEVSGPYDVKVATGGQPGASAKGGDKLLDETEVVVEGGTLKIRGKKHKGMRWSWGNSGKAEFTVTTAMLHSAEIAGSGGIDVDKVEGDFKGAVAGSGDLRLAAINGGASEFSIAGSGKITAAGKAQSAKLEIAGSGDIDAGGLAATDAEVSIAGSGKVRANASGTAKVEIMGSGDVNVTGGAKCSVSKAGSGNVTCG
jgi:hypothetical protein